MGLEKVGGKQNIEVCKVSTGCRGGCGSCCSVLCSPSTPHPWQCHEEEITQVKSFA